MSLINDALKRAKQAQPHTPKPAAGPALRPIEHRRGDQPDFIMGALVAVILLLAALLLWVWSHSEVNVVKVRARTKPTPVQPVARSGGNSSVTADPESFKPIFPMPIPVPHKAVPVAAVPSLAPEVTPVIAKVAPAPAPAPINYKLQSIFYGTKNPSAAINGKTIYVGSRINDARVVGIEKDFVTLALPNGETKILDLP